MPRQSRDVIIRGIALLKLAKALVLIVVGLGALSMWRHPDGWLGTWFDALAVDPHGEHLHRLLQGVASLTASRLELIGVGSLIYASLFVIEGIGLMLRRTWAEVMTVVVTISFIPLEIYELVEHRSAAKAVVIAANLLVVLYLLRRLRRERHWPFHR